MSSVFICSLFFLSLRNSWQSICPHLLMKTLCFLSFHSVFVVVFCRRLVSSSSRPSFIFRHLSAVISKRVALICTKQIQFEWTKLNVFGFTHWVEYLMSHFFPKLRRQKNMHMTLKPYWSKPPKHPITEDHLLMLDCLVLLELLEFVLFFLWITFCSCLLTLNGFVFSQE